MKTRIKTQKTASWLARAINFTGFIFLTACFGGQAAARPLVIETANIEGYIYTNAASWVPTTEWMRANAQPILDLKPDIYAFLEYRMAFAVTHLPPKNRPDDVEWRAAMSLCVSNYFHETFLKGPYKNDPYLLMGDMNEDYTMGRAGMLPKLCNPGTGLRLTLPSFTGTSGFRA